MLQNTKGIVLRSIKYGDTSLIVNIFTERAGVNSYIVQGVRTNKARGNRAGLLQPATMLEMIVYHKPHQNLQRLRDFRAEYLYTTIHEEVIKNSVSLFSVELLLRLLPEHAPLPDLFAFVANYFITLDKMPTAHIANFPLYFIIGCSDILGYDIQGEYSAHTPYLNMQDGAFTAYAPQQSNALNDEEARLLSALLPIKDMRQLENVVMNAATRYRLLNWYLEFLHRHSQHMGAMKSLAVLQAVLH